MRDGIPESRPQRASGLAALPRHHDVRRRDRRRGRGAHRRPRPRAGLNFIDTADVYNGGRSEEIVGRAIAPHRHWWVLATKMANPTGEGPNERGLSRRYAFQAVEASLRRLGTDVIDILYLHREDHATPLEETVRAIGDLIRQGKIRYFGVSNLPLLARRRGLPAVRPGRDRPARRQPALYNALNRQAEVEHLPACGHYGLGVVALQPARPRRADRQIRARRAAARGHARRPAGQAHHGDRMAAGEPARSPQRDRDHAEARGISPGQFAIAWVLNNRLVTAAIAGPRTEEQWRGLLRRRSPTASPPRTRRW